MTLIAERVQIRPIFVMFALGILLIISILVALRRRGFFTVGAGHTVTLVNRARSACGDAGFVVSIGVIFTLALSPLVWIHYYLLAVIPALWLCAQPARSQVGLLLATTFVLASSEPLVAVMRATHMAQWYVLAQALSWIPLWAGILVTIGSTSPPHRGAM